MCAGSFGQSNDKPAAQNPPAGQAARPAGKRPRRRESVHRRPRRKPEYDAYKAAIGADRSRGAGESGGRLRRRSFRTASCAPVLYKAVMQTLPAGQQCRQDDGDGAEGSDVRCRTIRRRWCGGAGAGRAHARHRSGQGSDGWRKRRKMRERALVTVDTDVPTAGYPPEQLNAFKSFLRSEAYSFWGRWLQRQEVGGCGGESAKVD